mgnify:CR=1 FL=1
MTTVELVLAYFPNLLLILCRMTGFFVTAPVFSIRNNVPPQFRIGIAVFVTFLVFFAHGADRPIPMDGQYMFYCIRETLIGVLLGFVAYLFFSVVQMAGAFMDMQMGFGIVNVVDPVSGTQSPVFGNFKFAVAMLLFLALDAHHYLLLAIMDSYREIPLDNSFFERIAQGSPTEFLTRSFSTAFTLALQMAAPLVASMFLVDVALGILAKTAPQFNVFVVGLPLKILAALAIVIILVPTFFALFQNLFATMFEHLFEMMRQLRSL